MREGTQLLEFPERFRAKFSILDSGCWGWTASKNPKGYGHFWSDGRLQGAHRWVYEWVNGTIPEGLTVDHTCRRRDCVNPAHLEAVPSRENTMRGVGPTATHSTQTHCIHGHELSGDNLIIRRSGHRGCRTCRRDEQKRYYRRKMALASECANGHPVAVPSEAERRG